MTLISLQLSVAVKNKLNLYKFQYYIFQLELLVFHATVAGRRGILGRECLCFSFPVKNWAESYIQEKHYFLPVILFVLCFSYAFVVCNISHEINLMHF